MTPVDTNVLLDIATKDPIWAPWSLHQFDAASIRGPVLINAAVYAEFSHAAAAHIPLLTRDPRRYRAYFSGVMLIAPSDGEDGRG